METLPQVLGDIYLWISSRPIRGGWRTGTQVVTVTARSPGEGATTIAAEVAKAFVAQRQGRVVLVDLDPARNALPRDVVQNQIVATGEWNPPAIASDLFATTHGFDVLRIDAFNLPNGFDLGSLVSDLGNPYDLIVFDAGPLQGAVLTKLRDVSAYTILVLDARKTTVPGLERLKRELRLMQLRVDGIMLNRAEVATMP